MASKRGGGLEKWDSNVPPNEEKTAFIMPHRLYYYRVMSFGSRMLDTSQRLMMKIFKPLIRHTWKYTLMTLWLSSCAWTFHNPFHGQAKALFPYTKMSQHNQMDKRLLTSIWKVKRYLTQPPISEQSSTLVMANFIVEVPHKPSQLADSLKQKWWMLHVDGESTVSRQYWSDLILRSTLSTKLEICNDSQLIVGQIQREYEVKDERMVRYFSKMQVDLDRLSEWAIKQIHRIEKVDRCLSKKTTTLPIKEVVLLSVYFQATSSIATSPVYSTNKTSVNWMNEIEAYIRTRELPEDSKCDRCQRYTPFLACPLKSSIRSQALAIRTLGNGHSWPPTLAATQKKFLLVATDYFSKWVKAEVYASIKDKDVSKFIWKNIVCRFGIL
ncbi:hypothetical protein CK203_039675 [Vitis vinifera]|uniref:Integrase catalytic domain-containing protein n=1 Tax=Vitis vinifera TaxID=29760 RepID=A0A438HFL0_VITVI|nr:hypothetical protein CK203_039675 [Vitis vinifera]